MDAVTPAPLRLPSRERTLAFVEIITVGFPFCAFKMLAGLDAGHASPFGVVAYSLVALGAVDLGLNLVNAITIASVGRRVAPVCCIHAALARRTTSRRGLGELGLALDTALSFALVAAMIGWSRLPALPRPLGSFWNVAVVLNVLGAGALRVADALHADTPSDTDAP